MSSSEYVLQTCCLLKNVKVLGKQCEVPRDTSATEQQDALCYAASQRWHLPPGPESPPASMQTPLGDIRYFLYTLASERCGSGKCQGVWYGTPPVPRPAFAPHPSWPHVPPADATAIIWAQVDLTASDLSSTPSSTFHPWGFPAATLFGDPPSHSAVHQTGKHSLPTHQGQPWHLNERHQSQAGSTSLFCTAARRFWALFYLTPQMVLASRWSTTMTASVMCPYIPSSPVPESGGVNPQIKPSACKPSASSSLFSGKPEPRQLLSCPLPTSWQER